MKFLFSARVRFVALLTLALASVAVVSAAAAPRGTNGQIAYDNQNVGVITANPDGNQAQPLVSDTCCPSWSHDGSKLALPYGTDDGRIGTATINADGSGYTPLPINHPTLNVACAGGAWSPDDAQLACESWDDAHPALNGIYAMSSANGSGLTRLTANPLGGQSHDIPGAYSPNGKQIVFVRTDANGDNGVGDLFVVKANTGQVRQIASVGGLLNVTADWSPQGNEILISRHLTPDVRGSLWVVHPDGSDLHEIQVQGLDCGSSVFSFTGFGCHAPRWSPDGKQIVFAANSRATGVNIYTVNADGSGLVQATQDGGDDDPVWGTHPLTP